jgi:dihydroxy-acid dehydratase
MVGHVCPEAMDGGPIALVRDGDTVTVDAENGELKVHISDEGLAARQAAWKPMAPRYTSGVLAKYAKSVGPASKGALTH